MKNAIVVPLMFAISLLAPRISDPPAKPIFVSGLVTDARTGEPIDGVRVSGVAGAARAAITRVTHARVFT